MTEAFLKELKGLEFDSLTAKEAVALRQALAEAMTKADRWMAGLVKDFGGVPAMLGRAEVLATPPVGRPPETGPAPSPPGKTPKKRGRPVPDLKVNLKVNAAKRPQPLAVGGADAATDGPRPAQIFQDSYVSKDGPQPGARLPPDHPRNTARLQSSVTPEVDMSDFAEAEAAMRKGQLDKVFQ
jgi:hypothetical protein